MLGDIVKKYESGNLGPRAISHDPNDPGGASYGTYQLAANTGSLQDFIDKMGYTYDFDGLEPGSKEFDEEWESLCDDDAKDFQLKEGQYIKMRMYDPRRAYATTLGFLDTPAINEAIWSI